MVRSSTLSFRLLEQPRPAVDHQHGSATTAEARREPSARHGPLADAWREMRTAPRAADSRPVVCTDLWPSLASSGRRGHYRTGNSIHAISCLLQTWRGSWVTPFPRRRRVCCTQRTCTATPRALRSLLNSGHTRQPNPAVGPSLLVLRMRLNKPPSQVRPCAMCTPRPPLLSLSCRAITARAN